MPLRRAGSVDVSVASLELLENPVHGVGRGGTDPSSPLALDLVGRLCDPGVVERRQVALAHSIVLGDIRPRDTRESQEQRGHEPRPVLSRLTVDDHAPVWGGSDGGDGAGEVRPMLLENLQVDHPRKARIVARCRPERVELGPALVVGLAEEREVEYVDVELARRISLELRVVAEVDDAPDAVVDERPPAVVREAPNAVRTDHPAELRHPAVARFGGRRGRGR